MKYACLLYSAEEDWDALSPEQRPRVHDRYGELERELAAAGRMAAAAELKPPSTATTVRVRDGQTLVTDAPYAATREQLGGFFVLECESMEEALEIARQLPAADGGAVEVRRENFWAGEAA